MITNVKSLFENFLLFNYDSSESPGKFLFVMTLDLTKSNISIVNKLTGILLSLCILEMELKYLNQMKEYSFYSKEQLISRNNGPLKLEDVISYSKRLKHTLCDCLSYKVK